MNEREKFVKLLRYSTPVTILILFYVGFVMIDPEFPINIIFVIIIIFEVVLGINAGKIYDMTN